MIILDGKKLKEKKLKELKDEVSTIEEKLNLTVIQVGNDPASCIYVEQKRKMAQYVGFAFSHIKLDENIEENELINLIEKLNNDTSVTGIIIQMPLPKHINETTVQNKILYYKDIDGLSDINAGKLMHNTKSLISCTPLGIMHLLEEYNIDIASKYVVIVGRSNLVGKPLVNLFLNHDATVSICHSKTKNLSTITKQADILIVAVGKKHIITKDMIKENAIVIDVGINRIDNKLYGDVDFDNVKTKVSYISPVPGGVGPMTVAEIGGNVIEAYRIGKGVK